MIKKIGLGLLLLVLLGVGGVYVLFHQALPQGRTGPEAEQLARKMLQAIHDKAWKETGAIRWVFWGKNRHLWDRKRWFAQVGWGQGSSAVEVTLSLLEPTKGIALRAGKEVSGAEREKLLRTAYAFWCNDSYWLNPMEKVFESSVTRRVVEKNGKKMLLVTFSSGGVTPGDSYLYELDEAGLPKKWWMWVSIIPVGGVEASFEGWKTMATGAKVSTRHQLPVGLLVLDPIEAAKDIVALVGKDPFQELVKRYPALRTQP